jgi:hypothetical protein
MDAHHEVHAALQVEAEPQPLGHEPRGRRQAVASGQLRVDADRKEDDEHREDRDDFPLQVLVHD